MGVVESTTVVGIRGIRSWNFVEKVVEFFVEIIGCGGFHDSIPAKKFVEFHDFPRHVFMHFSFNLDLVCFLRIRSLSPCAGFSCSISISKSRTEHTHDCNKIRTRKARVPGVHVQLHNILTSTDMCTNTITERDMRQGHQATLLHADFSSAQHQCLNTHIHTHEDTKRKEARDGQKQTSAVEEAAEVRQARLSQIRR